MVQKTKNRQAILWKFEDDGSTSMRVEIIDLGAEVYVKAEKTIKGSEADLVETFEIKHKLSFDVLMEDLIIHKGYSLVQHRNI